MSKDLKIRLLPFHSEQKKIYRGRSRRDVIRCGRRFGKTTMLEQIAANDAAHGQRFGFFFPNYKLALPTYKSILRTLKPIVDNASKTDMIIETINGGQVEFWTLDNPDAGRSRKYHRVAIDEASLVKKGLQDTWEQAIEPTLLDYGGSAIMAGTPKGIDDDNYFYLSCTDKSLGWQEWHAPTSANPAINPEELEKIRANKPPLVVQQEYDAEFVNWGGTMFFSLKAMLDDEGRAFPFPAKCDTVYAVVDSAIKTGSENDGTAVTYFSFERFPEPRVIVLDWDIVQIEGASLEIWLPSVFARCEQLATLCGARFGATGVHIEDKASGIILLQQAIRKGLNVHPIDSLLTSLGKDERAMNISGYVYQGLVGLSVHAYDKMTEYKQMHRNHFLIQVLGFKIGLKDQADDLLDTFCYGVTIALGNSEGV